MNKLQQANQLINEGNKKAARTLLKQILESDQNNESAWLLLYTCVDEISQQRDCLQRVLQINPKNINAQKELKRLSSLDKLILESTNNLPIEREHVSCFDPEKLNNINAREIWKVTHEVEKLLSYVDSSESQSKKDSAIREALQLSCNLLSSLVKNDIFFVRYEKSLAVGNNILAKNHKTAKSVVEFIASDLERLEKFLDIEINLLRNAGFDEHAVERLSKQIERRLTNIHRDHLPSEVSDIELKRMIAIMQSEICQHSKRCAHALQHKKVRSIFWLALAGIGSLVANIAANASIPPLMASASTSISADLITKLITDLVFEVINTSVTKQNIGYSNNNSDNILTLNK